MANSSCKEKGQKYGKALSSEFLGQVNSEAQRKNILERIDRCISRVQKLILEAEFRQDLEYEIHSESSKNEIIYFSSILKEIEKAKNEISTISFDFKRDI